MIKSNPLSIKFFCRFLFFFKKSLLLPISQKKIKRLQLQVTKKEFYHIYMTLYMNIITKNKKVLQGLAPLKISDRIFLKLWKIKDNKEILSGCSKHVLRIERSQANIKNQMNKDSFWTTIDATYNCLLR